MSINLDALAPYFSFSNYNISFLFFCEAMLAS